VCCTREILPVSSTNYRGRLAPSPTGYLHLGHARTFWIAARRARKAHGTLLLRNDDLDRARCRPEFVAAMQEDLHWLGLTWDGAMISQSDRLPQYRRTLEQLHARGSIFPCERSRRDVLEAAGAPHEGMDDDEPIYPKEFRPPHDATLPPLCETITVNWRFRVPDDLAVQYCDRYYGEQRAVAGKDFGDFLVWRKDDTPSYQLATVVDEIEFAITEVVRGADLIKSTFRQLLLFQALGATPPDFYHAPLLRDDNGQRLAKRHDALALRTLRSQGVNPETILKRFEQEENNSTSWRAPRRSDAT
jgi:glutamyl/glutaminyl-tRNA synthetase